MMDLFTDDAILSLASFLHSRDLVHLALTCKRFGGRVNNHNGDAPAGQLAVENAERTQSWSLMEEAARQRVTSAKQIKEWKNSNQLLSRHGRNESWIAVDYRLHLLQTSLVFHQIIGNGIEYLNNNPSKVEVHEKALYSGQYPLGCSCAIGQQIMKSGTHHVEFTVIREGYIELGIIRPMEGWDTINSELKTMHPRCSPDYEQFCTLQHHLGRPGYEGDVHCYLYTTPTDSFGRSNFLRTNDVIGFSLDLGYDGAGGGGTLTIYKNGRCLGVQKEGLSGYYCWVASMTNVVYGGAVQIKKIEVSSSSS